MATYIVCDNGADLSITITGAFYGNSSTRTYFDGDCNIQETSKQYRITASQAVDTAYTVWFTYNYQEIVDGVVGSLETKTAILTMPANSTFIEFSLVTKEIYSCSDSFSGSGGLHGMPDYNGMGIE